MEGQQIDSYGKEILDCGLDIEWFDDKGEKSKGGLVEARNTHLCDHYYKNIQEMMEMQHDKSNSQKKKIAENEITKNKVADLMELQDRVRVTGLIQGRGGWRGQAEVDHCIKGTGEGRPHLEGSDLFQASQMTSTQEAQNLKGKGGQKVGNNFEAEEDETWAEKMGQE